MSLSDRLADKIYGSDTGGTRASRFSKIIARSGIQKTSEFLRIERLPRRNWMEAEDLEELTREATAALKTPGGTMSLWPVQAAALRELYEVNGLFAPVAVGAGKSLVTLLAPVVLNAERPVLLVPASLRDQTLLRVIPEMRKHWKLHRGLAVIGYEELSLAKNAELLETLRPDLIIADECHSLKTSSSGRTRRVTRYMRAFPATRFVSLSGTVTKRSLRDYQHLLLWSLKPDFAPIPVHWQEMQDWSDVLDEKPPENREVDPGALKALCGWIVDEKTGQKRPETVREGYRRRLVETPGVIATSENELGVSLELFKRDVRPPEEVLAWINHMRATWETPNGDEITDPITLWQHERELAQGFYYKWSPAAPKEWLAARKAWNQYVRETLKTNRRGLDTPLQVWNETSKNIAEGRADIVAETAFNDWVAIRDTFKPNPVPVWISDFLVNDAAKWLAHNEGIIWVEHDAFGQALAKKTGRPYFGGGKNASREILSVQGPIIASIRAHGTGKNLERWNRNLVASPPPTGIAWEQMMGRTHRPGQEADDVIFDLYLFVDGQKASFKRAINDAKYIEATLGAKQKLCYASYGFDVDSL